VLELSQAFWHFGASTGLPVIQGASDIYARFGSGSRNSQIKAQTARQAAIAGACNMAMRNPGREMAAYELSEVPLVK
jgi:hypothetical protein